MAKKELETAEQVKEEERQNYITQQQALKAKKEARAKKQGKRGGAVIKNDEKDDDIESKKSEKPKQEEEVKYVMAEQYDNELSELRKVDFEYEQLLAKAKVRALKENKMDVYDGLEQKKMTRAAMKIYVQGGQKKENDSFDLTEVNKVWEGQDL